MKKTCLKIDFLGLILLGMLSIGNFPSPIPVNAETCRVYPHHGERWFYFSNGTYPIGAFRYAIDVTFKIYDNYSIIEVLESFSFLSYQAVYDTNETRIREVLDRSNDTYLLLSLYPKNFTMEPPAYRMWPIRLIAVWDPIVNSNSSWFKWYPVFHRTCGGPELVWYDGALYVQYKVVKVNYTDPELYYGAWIGGFGFDLFDAERARTHPRSPFKSWTFELPEGYMYELCFFDDLDYNDPYEIPMRENVWINNVTMTQPMGDYWYEKYNETYIQLEEQQENYTTLYDSYLTLEEEYNSLSENYSSLQENYSSLNNSFVSLQESYESCSQELNETSTKLNTMTKLYLPMAFFTPTILGIMGIIVARRMKK